MRNFSNKYIFTFSTVMVVVVAALLAFISIKLKPQQKANVEIEKMQSILTSVGIESTTKNAADQFNKYITDSYVLNLEGEKIEGIEAFNVDLKVQQAYIDKLILLNGKLVEKEISPFKNFMIGIFGSKEADVSSVKDEIKEQSKFRELPVYVCSHDDGNTYYVLPVRGKGLWGAIWGYISIESDMNTIYGAVFDHAKETPGLGAEIKEGWFEAAFKGKKLFDDNNRFKSIEVVKPGTATPTAHNVDAISGGTITSKGLEAMIFDGLEGYITFMENKRN